MFQLCQIIEHLTGTIWMQRILNASESLENVLKYPYTLRCLTEKRNCPKLIQFGLFHVKYINSLKAKSWNTGVIHPRRVMDPPGCRVTLTPAILLSVPVNHTSLAALRWVLGWKMASAWMVCDMIMQHFPGQCLNEEAGTAFSTLL